MKYILAMFVCLLAFILGKWILPSISWQSVFELFLLPVLCGGIAIGVVLLSIITVIALIDPDRIDWYG